MAPRSVQLFLRSLRQQVAVLQNPCIAPYVMQTSDSKELQIYRGWWLTYNSASLGPRESSTLTASRSI